MSGMEVEKKWELISHGAHDTEITKPYLDFARKVSAATRLASGEGTGFAGSAYRTLAPVPPDFWRLALRCDRSITIYGDFSYCLLHDRFTKF